MRDDVFHRPHARRRRFAPIIAGQVPEQRQKLAVNLAEKFSHKDRFNSFHTRRRRLSMSYKKLSMVAHWHMPCSIEAERDYASIGQKARRARKTPFALSLFKLLPALSRSP